jgi:hypothetical protein
MYDDGDDSENKADERYKVERTTFILNESIVFFVPRGPDDTTLKKNDQGSKMNPGVQEVSVHARPIIIVYIRIIC